MSGEHHDTPAAPEPRYVGAVAEFATSDDLGEAAAALRKAGYTRFECYSPHPVHGIDEAAGITPTKLPWVVFLFGATGTTLGFLLQWWTAGGVESSQFDVFSGYEITISGKPNVGAYNVIVCFEMTILLGAFSAFIGMLMFNGLPQFYHPLFHHPRFRRVTQDALFAVVDADDPKFDRVRTRDFLAGLHPRRVDIFEEPETSSAIPGLFKAAVTILTLLALVPAAMIAKARTGVSETPGVTRWLDKGMAFQPKLQPQADSSYFADGRSMRTPPAGTVASGSITADGAVHETVLKTGRVAVDPATRFLRGRFFGGLAAAVSEPYADEIPASLLSDSTGRVNPGTVATLMQLGRVKYNINCAPCHGLSGNGQGPVHERASKGGNPKWVQPQVLNGTGANGPLVKGQSDGRIYNTIVYGRANMQALGDRIPDVVDRWAIVLYVRALQRANNATIADVPPDLQGALKSGR